MRRLTSLFVVVFLPLSLLISGCKKTPPVPDAAINGEKGNIPLVGLDGTKVMLSSVGRRVTMIALWSTSCEPCMKELPYLDKLAASYAGDKDVAILAVNVNDELPAARDAVSALGLKLPVLADAEGKLTRVLSPDSLALPLLATVDAKFEIHRHVGFRIAPVESFIEEQRSLIEGAKNGVFPPPLPPPPSSSGAPFKISFGKTDMTLEQFRASRAGIRQHMKDSFHATDEQVDKMLADTEAQLADGGAPPPH